MAFSRLHEEHEVSPDLRRVYADIRSSFDLTFVPSLFKTLAASPEYLRAVWDEEGAAAIAVAHTRDDQAETLLLRLLR